MVFLLVAVTTITCAPQYPQIPRGFNQFNGASNFVCPNYPFCTNNAPAARPAQAAAVPAMINSGAISSLTSSAQQLASNPNVSAGVRNQINSILATVRQQNSGSVLPQVQSLLSLAQQQVQSQNLSPQEKSQANSIIANARQLLSSL